MFINLQKNRFPIPFTDITSAEQQLIERLDSCRMSSHHLIGEAKLSDRQTIIILSYLITALLRPSEEDPPKTVVYLCRGECRRRQLLRYAEEVQGFVVRSLASDDKLHVFSLQGLPISDSRVVLKFYLGLPQDERSHQETFQYCKASGLIFKRIYFLRDQKYLQFRLRRKEDIIWKKSFQFGCESDGSSELPTFLSKKADYLLIETNDMEGLLYELLTVDLPQIHLHRAFIEFRKLNRYYNYRIEERRGKQKHGSKKDIDQLVPERKDREESKKQREEKQSKTEKEEEEDDMQSIEFAKSNNPEKSSLENNINIELEQASIIQWNVADYDKKFNQLYKQKKELLMTAKVGYIPNTSVPPQYEECYYLMNLQIIGYVLSFLLLEWRQNQFQESHDSLNSFLNYVYSRTFMPSGYMRKLRRIFLTFVHKHPPRLLDGELSYTYIDQVLLFFEKAVIWNQIFCKGTQPLGANSSNTYTQNAEQNGNSEGHSGSNSNKYTGFMVFREKTNKDSNLKLFSFDQRIILELLSESAKSFSILQNLALSFEYYTSVFQPEKIKQLKFEYVCPKIVGEFSKNTINGFIVSSTPNEEDLHLSTDKQQSTSVDLLEDRKVDKDHYSQIIRAYGVLVHDICELTPDGVIVYFPSRSLLRECRTQWQSKQNIYEKINQIKRIYEEEEWQTENVYGVYDFKRRCQLGRGAVYFISAESEFAKFQTFYGSYSKCVIFLGVPYHSFPLETEQKLKFLRLKQHHHFEDALKNVCRCLSNCINSTADIKTVVFADIAYNRTDLQKKWFPFIQEGNLNTLQVLDWILAINKNCTKAMKRQRDEEKRRKVEETKRKQEDKIDLMRRSSCYQVADE